MIATSNKPALQAQHGRLRCLKANQSGGRNHLQSPAREIHLCQIGWISLLRALFLLVTLLFTASSSFGQFRNINIDILRRNVVFLSAPDGQNGLRPDGTGFLVSVPHKGGGGYLIIVTARQIVDPPWALCKSGPPGEIHTYFKKAQYDPSKDAQGTVDVPLQNTQVVGSSRTKIPPMLLLVS
jgi:hypothetical protein